MSSDSARRRSSSLQDLFQRAAAGDTVAQVELGTLYDQGRGGVPKDERRAADLFRAAAAGGNARGRVYLALYHLRGAGGIPEDERAATHLFNLAYLQGDADGQFALGTFCEHGRGGLIKDDRNAARLFALAVRQGNAPAQFSLGKFYEQGRGGLDRNVFKALRLYELAADQALPRARDALARLRKKLLQEALEKERILERVRILRERRRRQTEAEERKREALRDEYSLALKFMGLQRGATKKEIRSSYIQLMKKLHPDTGGMNEFAARLNNARDLLLRYDDDIPF